MLGINSNAGGREGGVKEKEKKKAIYYVYLSIATNNIMHRIIK